MIAGSLRLSAFESVLRNSIDIAFLYIDEQGDCFSAITSLMSASHFCYTLHKEDLVSLADVGFRNLTGASCRRLVYSTTWTIALFRILRKKEFGASMLSLSIFFVMMTLIMYPWGS